MLYESNGEMIVPFFISAEKLEEGLSSVSADLDKKLGMGNPLFV